MYKSYRAYTGTHTASRLSNGVDAVLNGINERDEEIVSVTAVGLDHIHVLIITKQHEDISELVSAMGRI
jgi:hypothetical protein